MGKSKPFFISILLAFSQLSAKADVRMEIVGDALGELPSSNFAEVYTEEEIETSSSLDLGDFFRQQGLSLVREGGQGQLSSLFLRGADPDHVLVLVDGVPMNDASNPDRRFDFSKIPLSEVRRIEILKGSQSVRYGSQAMGGVVRIWTHSSQDRSNYRLGGGYGSFETYNLQTSVNQNLGDGFFGGIAGQIYDSESYSAASGGRERDSFRSQSGSTSLSYSAENFRSQYAFRRVNHRADIDRGGGAANDDPNYITRYRQDSHSFLTQYFSETGFQHQVTFGKSDLERHSDNIADADSTATARGDFFGQQRRFEYVLEKTFFESLSMDLGVEETSEQARGESNFSTFPQSYAQKEDVFLQVQHELNAFSWNAGGRLESHSQFGSNVSGELGWVYPFSKSRSLAVRWAQATKWPSLYQLYDPTYGNAQLSPEHSTSYELSLGWHSNKSFGNINFFQTFYRDLIGSDPVSFRSVNQGRAKVTGAELFISHEIKRFRTEFRYQYLQPRNTDQNTELLRRPRHELLLSENWVHSKWNAGVWIQYKSKREDIDPVSFARTTLPEYWTWGVEAGVRFAPHRLWIRGENLSQKTYEEVAGYRASPRSFWLGWEMEI